jgi:hypothetical protein
VPQKRRENTANVRKLPQNTYNYLFAWRKAPGMPPKPASDESRRGMMRGWDRQWWAGGGVHSLLARRQVL